MELHDLITKITPANEKAYDACIYHFDHIAKPVGSLGKLETLLAKVAGASGTPKIDLSKKCVLVFCADNGVLAQGVAQSTHDVTTAIANSLVRHTTSVNTMAAACGADVFPVDMGMIDQVDGLIPHSIARGTNDISEGPAMTLEQAKQAILTGIHLVKERKEEGYRIIATGEAGIGNKPDASDALDVLAKVGGFDIAGMTGAFLGGAIYGIPVIMDGFISGVAALLAVKLCPYVKDYILPSHISAEPAGQMLMEALGLDPIIHANMRLGEGTGAVALMPLLDMAAAVYWNAASFDDINVEAYEKWTSN